MAALTAVLAGQIRSLAHKLALQRAVHLRNDLIPLPGHLAQYFSVKLNLCYAQLHVTQRFGCCIQQRRDQLFILLQPLFCKVVKLLVTG